MSNRNAITDMNEGTDADRISLELQKALKIDNIQELSSGAGVTVDGVKISDIVIGHNISRGILPDATAWDTPPSNLLHATNGDLASATGIGTKDTAGAATVGYITLDLGRPALVNTGIISKIETAAGAISIQLLTKLAGGGYEGYTELQSSTGAAGGEYFHSLTCLCYAQFIQFRFANSAAGVGEVTIYEIVALEVLL